MSMSFDTDLPGAALADAGAMRGLSTPVPASVAAADAEAEAGAASFGFERFYAATAPDLWAYAAASTGGDRGRADDIVQESFLRYLGAATVRFVSDEHRRRYVFRIASNLMEDERRRARRRPETLFSALERSDGESSPASFQGVPAAVERRAERDAAPAGAEERLDLRRAFDSLKPRERRLLWLAHVEECSHEEIGARLATKAASVRVLLFRARRRLVAALEAAGAVGPATMATVGAAAGGRQDGPGGRAARAAQAAQAAQDDDGGARR